MKRTDFSVKERATLIIRPFKEIREEEFIGLVHSQSLSCQEQVRRSIEDIRLDMANCCSLVLMLYDE